MDSLSTVYRRVSSAAYNASIVLVREAIIMAEKTLTQKLGIKPGYKLLVLNAPEGIMDALHPLPEGATLETTAGEGFDAVLAFVHHKADIDAFASMAAKSAKYDGLLWFAYPKQSSKVKTDIHRDVGWDAVNGLGFAGVAQVAVNETWAATRFRPADAVKRKSKG
jgi:hypothetical protein